MGWLSPVAVPNVSGRLIAYNTWDELVAVEPDKSFSDQGISFSEALGVPTIRLFDAEAREDRLFARGAFSVAWSPGGSIAYFKGLTDEFLVGMRYVGHIFVRDGIDAEPVQWTTLPERYIVFGWAGTRLLVYRQLEGEQLQVLSLDGTGNETLIADHAQIVAISPDGNSVALAKAGSHGPSSVLSIFDLNAGNEVASVDVGTTVDPETSQPVGWLMYGGSWTGNRLATEGGPGLLIFDVGENSVHLAAIIRFDAQVFPMGVHEPQLAAEGHVVGWAPVPGEGGQAKGRLYSYIDCEIATARCARGPTRGERQFHPVYNPSRS